MLIRLDEGRVKGEANGVCEEVSEDCGGDCSEDGEMRADFVNEVARALDIQRRDLIEKDPILHQMLTDLSQDNFFASRKQDSAGR
jgi:hypothetical protein